MQLTQSDAFAVHRMAKFVGSMGRNLITESELVDALFQSFHRCESDHGIQQCVAVMPKSLWAQIAVKADLTLNQTHPGQLAVDCSIKPAETELRALDDRLRHTMAVVTEYLSNPTGIVEYEIDDPNGMRQQWFLFKHFENVAGEKCRKPDCDEDRIHNGVYCRVHHYEMIFGQSPPVQQSNPLSRSGESGGTR